MCGIVGVTGEQEAPFFGIRSLSTLQGRGSQSAGVCWIQDGKIQRLVEHGLIRNLMAAFGDQETNSLQALAHTRYGTVGKNTLESAQPFCSEDGRIAIVHNGEIVEAEKFRKELKDSGVVFSSPSDSEVILRMLEHSEGDSRVARLMSVLEKVKGAYALLILWEGELIAATDQMGMHPLCLGAFEGGGHIFASEDSAIRAVGARPIEDVKPGQVIVITPRQNVMRYWINGQDRNGRRTAHCAFNLVYTGLPSSKIWGANVSEVRAALGRKTFEELLNSEKIPAIDIVTPMLDSGRTATLEFAKMLSHHRMMRLLNRGGVESLRTVDPGFLYPYNYGVNRAHDADRNFQLDTQSNREREVGFKHFGDPLVVKNKRVLIGDDSLVRGTTAKKVVNMLKDLGALEVHFVIFAPPVKASCYWGGVETKDQSKLPAAHKSVQEIGEEIGADSLSFISLEGFHEIMMSFGSGFCTACWGGEDPFKNTVGKTV